MPFLLIAGSFKNSRNAEIMKENLVRKGFAPEVLYTGGDYYRVVIGKFTGRQAAIDELDEFASRLISLYGCGKGIRQIFSELISFLEIIDYITGRVGKMERWKNRKMRKWNIRYFLLF